jgi:hypothetical protein
MPACPIHLGKQFHPEKPATPEFLFGQPEPGWCYYYTKAELAFQINDLDKMIALEKEAISNGYAPKDLNEWLIFIQAHALTGDLQTAQKISEKILRDDSKMHRGVCAAWKQIQARASNDAAKIAEIQSALSCVR